jgi:acyl-CoA thioester hydrolase
MTCAARAAGTARKDDRSWLVADELHVTHRGVVYPWQCDHMGHMNVMWYVGKFDEATWQLFAQMGLTPSYLREHQRGMAALEQRIAYKRELRAGDVIVVRSGVLEVRPKVLRFFHEMHNAETGELAAVTLLTAAHLDTALRKACPFAEEIAARARALVVAYEPPL